MPAVYTQRLILAPGLSGAAIPVLTIPAGYQAVFTCISWTTGLNAPPIWAALVHAATGAKFGCYQNATGTADFETQTTEGRWAFYSGEVILAGTSGAAFDLLVTGYLLALP